MPGCPALRDGGPHMMRADGRGCARCGKPMSQHLAMMEALRRELNRLADEKGKTLGAREFTQGSDAANDLLSRLAAAALAGFSGSGGEEPTVQAEAVKDPAPVERGEDWNF